MSKALGQDSTCSIARTLGVLHDTWTVLIVREAIVARLTRFQEFHEALGIASNMLSARLTRLVDEGIFVKQRYQDAGSRPRSEYVLTDAGRSLSIVIDALAQWSRAHRPRPDGTSPRFTVQADGRAVHLALLDGDRRSVKPGDVVATRSLDMDLSETTS